MAPGKGERGSVLMMTLAFFTLAFLMVGGLLTSSLVHERTLALHQEHVQSVYLLDSGVTWARAALAANPQWPGGSLDVPAGRIEARVTRNAEGRRELYVTGMTARGTRTVKVWLDEDGRPVLWQEVGNVQE